MDRKTSPASLDGQSPNLLSTSLYVGFGVGAFGSSIGSGYATIKGLPVMPWTLATGFQGFIFGSTFWFSQGLSRAFLKSQQRREVLSSAQELACSTIAGSVTGMTAGAFRGRTNVIPGAIVFGLLGLSGQIGVSTFTANADKSSDERPLLDRLAGSKWSLFTSIPDAEYKNQLERQIDGIDVELAMVNDQISALQKQRQAGLVKG